MEVVLNIINKLWPEMLIVSVILVTFRFINVLENKIRLNFNIIFKDVVIFCFVNYVIALFYIVSFQDVSWSTYNVTPFKEIFRYEIGSTLFFKNIIGNMVMFIPFGLAIPVILKTDKIRSVLFLSFTTSLTIEITQLLIGRVFDIDDILLNILGGILGLLIYKIINRIIKLIRGKYEQNRNIQSNK